MRPTHESWTVDVVRKGVEGAGVPGSAYAEALELLGGA